MKTKNFKIKEIKGDASFRKFYRKSFKKKTTIIVYSDKEKEKNLLIYDAINKILIKNKIKAPKIIKQRYRLGYIEIEDLGKKTILKYLKKNNRDLKYFYKSIDLLGKLQKIRDKKIKNFNNQIYKIPEYKRELLFQEAELFCKWHVPSSLKKSKQYIFNLKFRKEVKKLLSKLVFKNDTFVHRDFHVSNLMFNKNKISIIDSQDAVIGNKAYDLASFIDDVRFKTTKETKDQIYSYFLEKRKDINLKYLKNDFEILSVLRNLKIIGIFKRLAIRDNKKKYLKYLPYAWELINLRLNQNNNLQPLKSLLKEGFSREIR